MINQLYLAYEIETLDLGLEIETIIVQSLINLIRIETLEAPIVQSLIRIGLELVQSLINLIRIGLELELETPIVRIGLVDLKKEIIIDLDQPIIDLDPDRP